MNAEMRSTLRVLGTCLDVEAAGTVDKTPVGIYDCNSSGAQVWPPQANGSEQITRGAESGIQPCRAPG